MSSPQNNQENDALGTDPFERLKNLLLLILAFIFSSTYIIVLVGGLGLIAILGILLLFFKLLGFQ